MSQISYDGLTEAEVMHALYHATAPLGMGFLQHKDTLSLEDVETELKNVYHRGSFGIPHMDHPNEGDDGSLSLDYYHGHCFKLTLDPKTKTFDDRLFARDNGDGLAQRVVDQVRARKAGK